MSEDGTYGNPTLQDLKRRYDAGDRSITFMHLGEGVKEITTDGWTDTQIKNKTLAELDAMIQQHETVLETLEETLREQRNRIRQFERIRRRKEEIGGN